MIFHEFRVSFGRSGASFFHWKSVHGLPLTVDVSGMVPGTVFNEILMVQGRSSS